MTIERKTDAILEKTIDAIKKFDGQKTDRVFDMIEPILEEFGWVDTNDESLCGNDAGGSIFWHPDLDPNIKLIVYQNGDDRWSVHRLVDDPQDSRFHRWPDPTPYLMANQPIIASGIQMNV